MTFSLARSRSKYAVVGRLNEIQQVLTIAPLALRHMERHRQLTSLATEAGGQLFGSIGAGQVCVFKASGPYAGDERTRCRYRSDPASAQRAIEDNHKRGLLYLGEWHTHAEDLPGASGLDYDAMRRLIASSQLNSDALLMMIIGRARGLAGLGAWNVTSSAVVQWRLSEDTASI